ncbi:MAG: endolytic transglycosylase MltG [Chloroflexi bacterium]|nr:endolytic transglycosylase MltG [Chloroflexota bacterium]
MKRILRTILTLIILVAIVLVPIWIFQIANGTNISTPNGTSTSDAESPLSSLFLEIFGRLQSGNMDEPASSTAKDVHFTIEPGETGADVAKRLENAGLVRDGNQFRLLLRLGGNSTGLQAGEYILSPSMRPSEIINILQHGKDRQITVTIPEGWRMEQIADALAASGLGNPEDYLRIFRSGEFSYAFLKSRPEGTSLEGFLFPDTYILDAQSTPQDITTKMLDTFQSKVIPGGLENAPQKLTPYQVLILASIVEREAAVASERPTIASVYLNRLAAGIKLDADPTVQYALGYQKNDAIWWKHPLLLVDLDINSTYNTYRNLGLPPAPICNPGIAAIQAVLHPAQTDYLYFVANDLRGDGSHAFARTLEEHQANIQKYQRHN